MPTWDEETLDPDDTMLGHDAVTGRRVVIDAAARSRSVYAIGITGTGKSTLLEQIAYQDILRGDGLCFLDPHGDSAEKLLAAIPPSRRDDVIYWDPADAAAPSPEDQRFFGLNPFWCADPTKPLVIDRTADYFLAALRNLAAFAEAFTNAPLMTNMLRQLAVAFVANPGMTLVEAPSFLEDAAFRRRFYPALTRTHPQVRQFWERFDAKPPRQRQEETASSLNKLYPFQTTDLMRMTFGQAAPAVDLRRVMDEGRILIVRLSEADLGPDTAGIIGAFLVFGILQAALSRGNQPPAERRQFHLIADEFQTFMATAFPQLQEQARKFGVDSVVAHQSREQLDENLRERTRAVQNLVIFRVTGPNAMALANEFDRTPREESAPRQEFRRAVAPYPLKHLEQHGHADPATVESYKAFVAEVKHFAAGREFRDLWGSDGTVSEETLYQHLLLPVDNYLYQYLAKAGAGEEVVPVGLVEGVPPEPIQRILSRKWAQMPNSGPKPVFPPLQAYYRGQYDYLEWAWRAYNEEIHPVIDEARRLLMLALPEAKGLVGTIDNDETRMRYRAAERAIFTLDGQPCTLFEWFRPKEQHARRHFPTGLPMSLDMGRAPREFLEGDFGTFEHTYHVLVQMPYYFQCVTYERHLTKSFSDLAQRLAAQLPLVSTGQLESTLERSRPFSDVEAEIANTLSNLPQYHARCKLSSAAGAFEATIRTSRFEPQTDLAARHTIVERSRREYGMRRPDIEVALESRHRRDGASDILSPSHEHHTTDETDTELDFWNTAPSSEGEIAPSGT